MTEVNARLGVLHSEATTATISALANTTQDNRAVTQAIIAVERRLEWLGELIQILTSQ